jgi:hypothetical protein
MAISFLTKEPKMHVGKNTESSTNDIGKIGYLHVDG